MFDNLFNIENPVWRFATKCADLLILNLLFIVFSLPLFTIGASVTALYSVTMKIAHDDDYFVLRGFVDSFKENFKQSTFIWIVWFFASVLTAAFVYLSSRIDVPYKRELYISFFVPVLSLLIGGSYVFPLQAKFHNSILGTIKNSILMGIMNLVPWSVLIVLINSICGVIFFVSSSIFLTWVLPFLVFFGFALIALINSLVFNKVFAKYIPIDSETK